MLQEFTRIYLKIRPLGQAISFRYQPQKKTLFHQNNVFYIKNTEDKTKIEAYEILNSDLAILSSKNAIALKEKYTESINTGDVLNLDKSYIINIDNIDKIEGFLPEDVQAKINDNIDFLKKRGYIKSI